MDVNHIIYFFIGAISGIISSLGMGGGTILILCLSLFMEIDQHIAQGTNLIFFIPTAIVAVFINQKNKLIKWKTGLVIITFGIIGTIIGAKVSINLDTNKLKLYFGIFLLCVATFEIYSMFDKKEN